MTKNYCLILIWKTTSHFIAIGVGKGLVKGDGKSFSKWLPRKFYFGYTVSITIFYVGFWHKLYMLQLWKCFKTLKWGLKLKEIILAPFRKWNSFNNFRKDVKFGTYWADSLLNPHQALYNIFHNGLIHKSLNNIWTSLGTVMFSYGSK